MVGSSVQQNLHALVYLDFILAHQRTVQWRKALFGGGCVHIDAGVVQQVLHTLNVPILDS